MILADTSAWVEYLRDTDDPVNDRLRQLIAERRVATTDVVMMEVLAGARDASHRRVLRRALGQCEYLRTQAPSDYEAAAELSATCRRAGYTIRQLSDCLIAAVALRTRVSLLHSDRDFDALARCVPLTTAP